MRPLAIEWRESAKADVRRLSRSTALRVFEGILTFRRLAPGMRSRSKASSPGFGGFGPATTGFSSLSRNKR
jgi:hypothetical protein